jgi:flagellar hook assembly protein FlgD
VYAQDGRLVKQVQIPAGETRWVWDGRDDSGLAAPSAVYVVGAGTEVRSKIIKLK